MREGEDFAGYTILRRLGAGGMGEVYLARHPRLPKQVAVKLLNGSVSTDSAFRERFLREADLSASLWHPHIVGVHDRGEHDGQLWIAMDYVDGQDAAALLSSRYPAGMPVELVTAIVTAVGSALDYAHKQGLLHRDVKPANIVITDADDPAERRILLTDFGIARQLDDVSGLTQTNMTVGTVAYTAPEQLRGESIDGRADQYSLAATAYQLLTGTTPFPSSNPAAVIGSHLTVPPPPLTQSRPDLARLDPVLALALAKKPEDRFRHCADFARALSEQADRTADPAQPFAVTAAAPIPPRFVPVGDNTGRQPRWASPTVVVLGAVAAVGLVIIGALLVGRKSGSAPASAPPTPTPPTVTVPETITKTVVPPAVAAEPVTTPPLRTEVARTAIIVGTCDEGGSCGVRQRTAPYNDAPRMFPAALQDGARVTVVCGITGDLRSSQGYGSSRVWFRLDNGSYINSVYTDTPPADVPSC